MQNIKEARSNGLYQSFNSSQELRYTTLGNSDKAINTIVFIDSAVEDYQSLVNCAIPEAEVIVLDSTRDGVVQITEVLQERTNIAAIHIVSHGSSGCLYLGNTQLSFDTLERYASQLQTWAAPLFPSSLLLYGCNVAAGDAGEEFIERLHQLTGVNIAAAAGRVGNTAKSGSWHLEHRSGEIVAGSVFLPELIQAYPGVFAVSSNDGNLLPFLSDTEVKNLTDALLQPFQTLKPAQAPKNLLTILWDPHRPTDPAPTKAAVESILYGATNSVQDYYLENSNGQFTINNAGVLGWYDADKPAEHYWNHPNDANDGWLSGHVEKWAEAIGKADQDFDFAAYDSNSDGNLTPDELGILMVIPQNSPFGTNQFAVGLQSPFKDLIVDGVKISANEQGHNIAEVYIGNPLNLGVVAHELGHLLLDHADMHFGFDNPFAAGDYSLMDRTYKTTHLDPFAKLKLGWVQPNVVSQSGYYDITDVETKHNVWILMDPQKGTDEYFIVENRWPGNSYDSQMSDSGLAVWHIIENPNIYGSQIPPVPPGFSQASWQASWSTVGTGDWGRRAIQMIKPVWNTFTDSQALWDGSNPATGYDLLSNGPDPLKATLRWADGTPSGFAIKNIPGSAATMSVFIELSSLTVDTLEDENDGDFSAGDLSLREAIALSKTGGTINIDSSLAGGTITLTQGELKIDKNLTISGLGTNNLTISGNNSSRIFKIDDGTSNLIDVEIEGLTITEGNVSGDGNAGRGGGILNYENLTITDSSIEKNKADDGGGVSNRGTLKVTDSTIKDNIANDNGGGIDNRGGGTVTLTHSTIENNVAADEGGGISNGDGSILWVTDQSIISGNTAIGSSGSSTTGVGGGILNDEGSTLTVRDSTISGNTATNSGGGIFNDSMTELTNSTISDNTAGLFGGGIFNDQGNVTVTNTTVSGNRTDEENGSAGGGIYNIQGTVAVSDSTISDNYAHLSGGGIGNSFGTLAVTNSTISGNTAEFGSGGGIDSFARTVTITNSTISGNTAGTDGGGINTSSLDSLTVINSTITDNTAGASPFSSFSNGGGISSLSGGTIKNTIIAGNSVDTQLVEVSRDVYGFFDTTDSSFNLIGDGTGSNFTNGVNGNIVGTSTNPIDPKLGPLQDNGGPTFTHALLDGSPAINAGNNANIPAGISTDQRGEPRVVGGTVDIGAFESAFTPVMLPIVTTPNDDIVTATPGNDSVISGGGQDQIFGDSGDDLLDGGDGDDRLFGGEDNDTLLGGSGQDRLFGEAGDDLLDGGAGDNTLNGGSGSDIFVVSTEGKNTIVDFEDGQDLLKLVGGLTIESLSIFNQNGDTWITTNNNQPLAFLTDVNSNLITTADFTV